MTCKQMHVVKYHDMNRETFIAKLTRDSRERRTAALNSKPASTTSSRLISTDHAGNTAPLCERAGKSGKAIERCVISTFQVAESMGFKSDFRQWEELLRIGD